MLYPRVKIAKDPLSGEGLVFTSIDDNEQQSLREICDEVFGEGDFVATFIWEKRETHENRKVISVRHDYMACYSENYSERDQALRLGEMNEDVIDRYKNLDNDPRGPWTPVPAIVQGGHGTRFQFYISEPPLGEKSDPSSGSC